MKRETTRETSASLSIGWTISRLTRELKDIRWKVSPCLMNFFVMSTSTRELISSNQGSMVPEASISTTMSEPSENAEVSAQVKKASAKNRFNIFFIQHPWY